MTLLRLRRDAPDQSGRSSTPEAVALVRALDVVVPHEAVEGPLQRPATGEVVPTEGHTPVLLENRALQSFDKAVGPGMARCGARVPDVELAAGRRSAPPAARARSAGCAAWPGRPGAAAAARCWAPSVPARSARGRPRFVDAPRWPR